MVTTKSVAGTGKIEDRTTRRIESALAFWGTRFWGVAFMHMSVLVVVIVHQIASFIVTTYLETDHFVSGVVER